ncbi:MAG: hypothetical protein GQF41_0150 [Candidatus Rifleibacterium amylolyticum]|nr:MAG: hypothetical protein GQF41_0150 [Candidatus Rifleibacterium amylolyticum]
MNNDILAGISGVFTFELPQNKQSATDKSASSDFLSLLQQQLGATSAENMVGEVTGNARIYSFSAISAINPLLAERPEKFEIPVRNDQFREDVRAESFRDKYDNVSASERTGKEAQNVASEPTDSPEKIAEDGESKTDASGTLSVRDEALPSRESTVETQILSETSTGEAIDLAEGTEGADSLSANRVSDSETEVSGANDKKLDYAALVEELAGTLTEDEKVALVEFLQGLSPQELAALSESPESFKEVLGELIDAMPDSEARDELLTLAESPELMQLLQNLADQQKAAEVANAQQSMPQTVSETIVQEAVVVEHERKQGDKNSEEHAVSHDPTELATVVEAADAVVANNSEGETLTEEKAASDTERHETTRNTKEKNVETSQLSETSEQPKNEESLREEFKRLNQPINEAASSSDQAETADEPVLANKSNMQTATAQPVTPEHAKAAVEEAAKKFFSLFTEKTGGGEKATEAATYSPEAVKRHSAMNNNSAGHGSNGFSSHNGTPASSMSAARPATPVPAATHIFSQMLEKAEYLKTENGSKILNMELDPGDLGKLEMELTSRDGTVSARISAESALAKARLEELAPQIKEQLLNQGVNLTEITVDISSRNPDESNRNQMSGRKNRSSRIQAGGNDTAEAIIRKNVLPNLRRAALNIKAVDLTV